MFTSSTTIYVALVTLLILSVLMYVLSRSIGCCNGKNKVSLFGKSCKGHWKTRSIGEQCGLAKCTAKNKPYPGCIKGLCPDNTTTESRKWCKKAKCIQSKDGFGNVKLCSETANPTDITACYSNSNTDCVWVEDTETK